MFNFTEIILRFYVNLIFNMFAINNNTKRLMFSYLNHYMINNEQRNDLHYDNKSLIFLFNIFYYIIIYTENISNISSQYLCIYVKFV